jgi:hypothetical protein
METFMKVVSLVGSGFATASTLYFWLIRANRERPQLKTYLTSPFDASFLAGSGDTMRSQFYVKAVVANYSTLPNAILGARTWVKARDGSWQLATTIFPEKNQVPCNLAPLQTVPLQITTTIVVPAPAEGTPRPASQREAAFQSVAQPVEIKVELRCLGDKHFTDVLTTTSTVTSAAA